MFYRLAAVLVAVFFVCVLLIATALPAANDRLIHRGAGLLCDTPEQVEEFVAAYTDTLDAMAAVEVVNAAHEQSDDVCVVGMEVLFYPADTVRTVETPEGTMFIMAIEVIGVVMPNGAPMAIGSVVWFTITVRDQHGNPPTKA